MLLSVSTTGYINIVDMRFRILLVVVIEVDMVGAAVLFIVIYARNKRRWLPLIAIRNVNISITYLVYYRRKTVTAAVEGLLEV